MKSISLTTLVAGAALAFLTGSALAAGDPAAGEKVFAKCKACHKVGEGATNLVGPELNGLDGRKAGAAAGFNYSDAMKGSGITWAEAPFTEFVKKPSAKVAGTKMVFPGLAADQDAADLWAYLAGFGADGKKK